MKRIITVFLIILLIPAFSLTAFATAPFATAHDLYQMWAPSKFPDYVCGVWSNDGSMKNLTIAVLDTEEGNNGKEEILELIEDDSTVTFTYGEYSRNYLTDVQDELMELFKSNEEHGLISTALDEYESRINLGILKEYKGNENTEQLLCDITAEYGDIFTVSYCDEPIEDTLLIAPIGETVTLDKKPSHLPTIILIAILLFCITFMVIRKRRAHLLQTSSGKIVSESPYLCEREIENLLKKTQIDYPKELDKKIMDIIEKNV